MAATKKTATKKAATKRVQRKPKLPGLLYVVSELRYFGIFKAPLIALQTHEEAMEQVRLLSSDAPLTTLYTVDAVVTGV